MGAIERWNRPAPARAREIMLDAESRRDYETAALAAVSYAEQIGEGYSLTTEHLLQQAQVYAALHLTKVSAAIAESLRPKV